MELGDRAPLRPVQVPGSVVAWREDDVAFEVSGRNVEMVELGTYRKGRWLEGGEIKRQGEIIARVDPEPYQIARDTAQADLAVAKRILASAVIELEQVLPAQQKAAAAQLVRAGAELDRYTEAFKSKSVSEVEVIRARAERDSRSANVEELLAQVEQQKARLETLRARIKQSEEAVRQAKLDLRNCTLFAPFDGEVAELYSVAGGYARSGSRVAHIIMMDPVKVDVALSEENASRTTIGDSVNVFLPGDSEPTSGAVFEKSSTADPETRTFRISVFVRNYRQIAKVPPGDPRLKHPRIGRFQYAYREHARSGKGPYMVEEEFVLRKDPGGTFVWRMEGYKRGQPIRTGALISVSKVRVDTTDYVRNLQGIMRFRGVADTGELKEGDLLAWGIPEDFTGGQVLLAQERWKLRPGQVVTAILERDVPPAGHWVPLRALATEDRASGRVYVVDEDKVRIVKVRITNSISEFFRIEPVDEDGRTLLKTGARLVVDYIHFLSDGESVKVTRTRRAGG
ncbi:MAG: HlyD family secretion protein [Planctomycetota bacterium]|jgi:multidrug efflux pump subunit AcrA (membrane-fusion protein)